MGGTFQLWLGRRKPKDIASGTLCLAEATFDTEDREVTTACPGGYKGVAAESAAQIISKVATACDINPQVLLVLIQKEQGLPKAAPYLFYTA